MVGLAPFLFCKCDNVSLESGPLRLALHPVITGDARFHYPRLGNLSKLDFSRLVNG